MKLRRRYKPTQDAERPRAKGLDGGWAWMICLAAHLCMMFSPGFLTSLGVLYIEWKEYFDLTATASSWIVSIPFLVASPLSLLSGVIVSQLGVRRVAMVGAAINGLATILGSLSTDVLHLYLCGIMSGIGTTLMIPPSMIIVTQYFKSRYALANGIVGVGASVGQMVFAPLLRTLIDIYGWRGAMFIAGAVQVNGVAACALFRPPDTYQDKVTLSNRDITMETLNDTRLASDTKDSHISKENPSQTLRRNLMVFRDAPTLLMQLVTSLYAMGLMVNLVHLPSRAKEAGLSAEKSSMLLTIIAIMSLATRPTHGWFVDRNYISASTLQLIVLLGAAIVTFLNPVSDSYAFLVTYSAFMGVFIGTGSVLLIYNLKTLVKPAQVPAALSLITCVFFLFNGMGTIIAGKIYDSTGNYVAPFMVGGAMFLGAFLLFAVVAFIKRQRERRVKETVVQSEEFRNSGEPV